MDKRQCTGLSLVLLQCFFVDKRHWPEFGIITTFFVDKRHWPEFGIVTIFFLSIRGTGLHRYYYHVCMEAFCHVRVEVFFAACDYFGGSYFL